MAEMCWLSPSPAAFVPASVTHKEPPVWFPSEWVAASPQPEGPLWLRGPWGDGAEQLWSFLTPVTCGACRSGPLGTVCALDTARAHTLLLAAQPGSRSGGRRHVGCSGEPPSSGSCCGHSAAWPNATCPSREQALLCSSHWERTLVPVLSLGSGRPDLCPPGVVTAPSPGQGSGVQALDQLAPPRAPSPRALSAVPLCGLPHPTPGCSGSPHGGPCPAVPVPADHLPPPLVSLQYTSSMRAKYLATSQPRPNSSSSGH